MSQTLTRASFFSSEVIVNGDLAASSKHTVTALGSNNTLHASNFIKQRSRHARMNHRIALLQKYTARLQPHPATLPACRFKTEFGQSVCCLAPSDTFQRFSAGTWLGIKALNICTSEMSAKLVQRNVTDSGCAVLRKH